MCFGAQFGMFARWPGVPIHQAAAAVRCSAATFSASAVRPVWPARLTLTSTVLPSEPVWPMKLCVAMSWESGRERRSGHDELDQRNPPPSSHHWNLLGNLLNVSESAGLCLQRGQ